jgi:hypothetical protein
MARYEHAWQTFKSLCYHIEHITAYNEQLWQQLVEGRAIDDYIRFTALVSMAPCTSLERSWPLHRPG